MLGRGERRGRRLTFEVNISGRSTGDPELLELIEGELRAHRRRPVAGDLRDHGDRRRSPTSRARRSSPTASPRSAAASRSTTSAPAFASFYYLKHLPFDYLKIDGEFVRGCATDRTDQLVIQAVVDIARGLGKRTVAEMVGDEETLELLRELGVDYAQGFHIGRPAPLARWLVDSKPADRWPPTRHGQPGNSVWAVLWVVLAIAASTGRGRRG